MIFQKLLRNYCINNITAIQLAFLSEYHNKYDYNNNNYRHTNPYACTKNIANSLA